MRTKTKKTFLIVFVLILLLGLGLSIFYYISSQQNQTIYEKVQKEYVIEIDSAEEKVEIPIDFKGLKEVNPDIYAWIDIEDTNIHYPIVQSKTDDTYYLEHTIEGVKGYPGSIYTESLNRLDFTDFNTVIYGHEMRDGSMFKHLHKFKDPEFFETHDTVMIYTETEIKEYRVYAALVYDNRHLLYHFNSFMEEERDAFIQSLHDARSMQKLFREGMTIDSDSRLITLSTCITGQPSKRYLVVAAEVTD